MRLQYTIKNEIMMEVRRDYGGFVNKISLKWEQNGVWHTSTDAWETSVAPALDLFPFTSDVNVKVASRNSNDTVQVCIKRLLSLIMLILVFSYIQIDKERNSARHFFRCKI